MYFTDRGIEELQARRGEDEVSLAWLADQLRTFIDQYPETTPQSARRLSFPTSFSEGRPPARPGGR